MDTYFSVCLFFLVFCLFVCLRMGLRKFFILTDNSSLKNKQLHRPWLYLQPICWCSQVPSCHTVKQHSHRFSCFSCWSQKTFGFPSNRDPLKLDPAASDTCRFITTYCFAQYARSWPCAVLHLSRLIGYKNVITPDQPDIICIHRITLKPYPSFYILQKWVNLHICLIKLVSVYV